MCSNIMVMPGFAFPFTWTECPISAVNSGFISQFDQYKYDIMHITCSPTDNKGHCILMNVDIELC